MLDQRNMNSGGKSPQLDLLYLTDIYYINGNMFLRNRFSSLDLCPACKLINVVLHLVKLIVIMDLIHGSCIEVKDFFLQLKNIYSDNLLAFTELFCRNSCVFFF